MMKIVLIILAILIAIGIYYFSTNKSGGLFGCAFYKKNGKCVSTCDSKIYDHVNNQCVDACPEGTVMTEQEQYGPTKGWRSCQKCPKNQVYSNVSNACISLNSCVDARKMVTLNGGGVCVDKCSSDELQILFACMRNCEGKIYHPVLNKCVTECPPDFPKVITDKFNDKTYKTCSV